MSDKKKGILLIAIVTCIIWGAFCVLLRWDIGKCAMINPEEYILVQEGIDYYIDEVNYTHNAITIQGWAIKKGENIDVSECYIVLKDTSSGEYMKIPTKIISRGDLTEYFNDGFNYDYSGFFAKVLDKKLNKNSDFDIYILYQNNNEKYLIDTQMSI